MVILGLGSLVDMILKVWVSKLFLVSIVFVLLKMMWFVGCFFCRLLLFIVGRLLWIKE